LAVPISEYRCALPSTEEQVFAPNNEWPDYVFSQVIVDVQSSIAKITDQLVPLVIQVILALPAALPASVFNVHDLSAKCEEIVNLS